MLNFLKNTFQNTWHNTGGAAAVEFIFVFPLFLSLWVGVTEISNIQMAQTKTNNMAYVISLLTSSLTSGDVNETHPLTGKNYDGVGTFNALPSVADKLAGGLSRGDNLRNGVFIRAVNRCPGQASLTPVFTISEGTPNDQFNSRLQASTLNEGEGIYFVAVQQAYDSIMGAALTRDATTVNFANSREAFYIVKPRLGGLIRDFNGDTRCPAT